MASTHTTNFLAESKKIIDLIDLEAIDAVASVLAETKKQGGRLFFAGSGGGAGHSSHAAADFRKLANIESYSVSDNVSELTARVNDESWEVAYSNWLKVSNLRKGDCLFVFSVGGGNLKYGISPNLVSSIVLAKEVGASVVGVVGRDGGYLGEAADAAVVIPQIEPENVTTQVEGFQALVWHLLIGHPLLESATPKWESSI